MDSIMTRKTRAAPWPPIRRRKPRRLSERPAENGRCASRRRAALGAGRHRGTRTSALRRGHRRADPSPNRSGVPGWSRASRWPSSLQCSTSEPPSLGQWGLRGSRREDGPSYEEAGGDRGGGPGCVTYWLDRLTTEGILAQRQRWSTGISRRSPTANAPDRAHRSPGGRGRAVPVSTFSPRQRRDRRLCLADFYRAAVCGAGCRRG